MFGAELLEIVLEYKLKAESALKANELDESERCLDFRLIMFSRADCYASRKYVYSTLVEDLGKFESMLKGSALTSKFTIPLPPQITKDKEDFKSSLKSQLEQMFEHAKGKIEEANSRIRLPSRESASYYYCNARTMVEITIESALNYVWTLDEPYVVQIYRPKSKNKLSKYIVPFERTRLAKYSFYRKSIFYKRGVKLWLKKHPVQ